jgi:hypothetical protein
MLRQGATCEVLQNILGHANIDGTQNIFGLIGLSLGVPSFRTEGGDPLAVEQRFLFWFRGLGFGLTFCLLFTDRCLLLKLLYRGTGGNQFHGNAIISWGIAFVAMNGMARTSLLA